MSRSVQASWDLDMELEKHPDKPDPGCEKRKSTSWWKELQSHIAKDADIGKHEELRPLKKKKEKKTKKLTIGLKQTEIP